MTDTIDKLTMYSLFKMVEDGPPPFEKPDDMDIVKYRVWKQQKDKSELECKKEYILLISEFSKSVNGTLEGIMSGKIDKLNYKSKNLANSTGGALAKSVPKPKDLHVAENQKFVASLNKRELELK